MVMKEVDAITGKVWGTEESQSRRRRRRRLWLNTKKYALIDFSRHTEQLATDAN
jgi:hypothetical protein